MNELLQKHGCSNVFTIPEGLRELMSDISREVLREQPPNIFDFIANYLSVLLITREHGILAVKILDDLCDCRPSVSEHLIQLGLPRADAAGLAELIKEEIESFEPVEGKEKVKETEILKKILKRCALDEDTTAKVCQVARNAYRDYWYRKKLLEQTLKVKPEEPWEIAAQHTLELYKKTKPSFSELTRATQRIQAAYRGYHVRKNLLHHLKSKPKKTGPKVELPGPPLDVAASREIELGRVINIKEKVREDEVEVMFDDCTSQSLGLKYDPMRTITHVDAEEFEDETMDGRTSRIHSRMMSPKSMTSPSQFSKSAIGVEPSFQDENAKSTTDTKLGASISYQPAEGRQSRLPSIIPAADILARKISFAQEAENVVINEEVVEEVKETIGTVPDDDIPEVIEVSAAAPEIVEVLAPDASQEVPEDITDDRTEEDAESAPSASVPSSTPATADTTDVEDEAGGTSEEEGE